MESACVDVVSVVSVISTGMRVGGVVSVTITVVEALVVVDGSQSGFA